jgi:TgpA N-terminal domain/Transglutaminase-like superfamily
MNQRRHLSFVAAAATLMTAAPLHVLFSDWAWLVDCFFVVAVVCAVSIGVRALRLPVWVQPIAGVIAVAMVVTLLSVRDHAILGLIPGPAAWQEFGQLLSSASDDIQNLGIPVRSDPGLLMLTTAGVGLVAVLVDLLAVGLRRPAAAGLPMLAVYAVPVAIDLKSISFIPFAIGAAGFLWLLVTDNVDRVRLFGRRFTGDGKGVDMWEPSPLAAVGRRIAVGCVALAILLPIATPGFGKGLVGVLGTVGGDGSGSGNCSSCTGTNTVDLLADLAGRLTKNSTTILATVKTDDPNPGYLRFAVASKLTPKGFLTVTPDGQPVSKGLPNSILDSADISFAQHHASVIMGNFGIKYLPIYTTPTSHTLKGIKDDWLFDQDSDTIFTTQTETSTDMTYSFDYQRPIYTPDQLRQAEKLAPSSTLEQQMAAVPLKVPQVQAVLDDPSTQGNTEYDRVLGLYKWFSSAHGFAYSTATKSGSTGTDIGDFLTNKVGYCVQFAAALAWLVRAAGFPARVALGFNPGTQDSADTWTLTNLNLHAWTEVYFDGFGWVPFDATPSQGGTSFSQWAPDPNFTPTPQNSSGSTGPDTNITPGAPKNGPGGPTGGPTGTNASGRHHGGSSAPWWTLGIVLVLLALAATPFLTRARLRRMRTAGGGANAAHRLGDTDIGVVTDDGVIVTTERRRVHAVWDEFMDTLVDFGFGIDPSETPRTAAERVASTPYLPDDVVADVRLLGQAEERARYAARPGSPPSFAAAIRRIRHAFADRAPWRTRLRATLLPPSVAARWRTAIVGSAASISAGMQTARDGVVRAVNVRGRLAGSRR